MRWKLTLAAALVSCLPVAAQNEPFLVHDTKPLILSGPYLLTPTETSVTIAWITDTPCHSKVVFGLGGDLSREAETAEHGLLRIGLRQAVRITGLEPGKTYQYRAISTRVVKMKSYWPEKGLSVVSPVYSFTTFDRKKPSVSFSLITDSHEDVARIETLTRRIDWQSTDFLVHLGDAFQGVENEDAIWSKFLDPVSKALAHRVPLVYARGNHDARGPGARSLIQYVPIPEGRFYYAREHGPLHLLVLDTGEDKNDNTNVYSRLNSFKAYREEEFAWFEQHVRSDPRMSQAPFRVLLMHAPNWGWVDSQNEKWTALANRANIDLVISGHTHRFSHSLPGQRGKNYHELVIGPDHLARVDATATELKVVVTNKNGGNVESFTLAAKRGGSQ